MKRTWVLVFVLLAALVAWPGAAVVHAEEKSEPAAAADVENEKTVEDPAAEVRSAYKEKIEAATKELGETFSEEQNISMGRIRMNFGIIRAIGIMKQEIGDAAKKCGDANKDMKDSLTKRFTAWEKTVTPLLKEDEKNLEDSIKKSSFPDEKKVHDYLDLVDEAAEAGDKALGEKSVVTTPEACRYLLESMDKSEPMVITLLKGIKWPMLGDVVEEKPATETKEEEKSEDSSGDKAE